MWIWIHGRGGNRIWSDSAAHDVNCRVFGAACAAYDRTIRNDLLVLQTTVSIANKIDFRPGTYIEEFVPSLGEVCMI